MRQTITTPRQMDEILVTGRRRAGLTQAEAAVRIGVSQSRISTLETGSGTLTLTQLLALFGAYGIQLQAEIRDIPSEDPSASAQEW